MAMPRIGRLTTRTIAAATAIAFLSLVTLIGYQEILHPEIGDLNVMLPVEAMGGVVLAWVIFPLVNASLEELIFRGILFDAIRSDWGPQVAVGATALLFGYGHLNGYPPGWTGACLAGIYAILLGWLRLSSGGLLLPILAHAVADATIYGIYMANSGLY